MFRSLEDMAYKESLEEPRMFSLEKRKPQDMCLQFSLSGAQSEIRGRWEQGGERADECDLSLAKVIGISLFAKSR